MVNAAGPTEPLFIPPIAPAMVQSLGGAPALLVYRMYHRLDQYMESQVEILRQESRTEADIC